MSSLTQSEEARDQLGVNARLNSTSSMYVSKSKSAKGRSSPAVNSSDPAGTQRPPGSPYRNLRSRSQPVLPQPGQPNPDQVLHLPRPIPAASSQPFNRYAVLPSIERRRSEGGLERSPDTQTDESDDAIRHEGSVTRSSEVDTEVGVLLPVSPEPPEQPVAMGSLLLAIRAPCGRRFQQHFDPADTLRKVRASAELRYGARYGEASIGTMDLPRRTFTDLDLTLAQCGILNKSVLCISMTG